MRTRDKLNNQYKEEKANGLTTATSFKAWLAEQNTPAEESEVTTPSVSEVLEQVEQALEIVTNEVLPAAQEATAQSKAAIALSIYEEEDAKALAKNLKVVRNDVIKRFLAEAGLSKNGAATYYQNIRRKKGLITH